MTIVKSINFELFKLKHRYFYLTWVLLTVPILAYIIYDLKDSGSYSNFVYQNTASYYYDNLLKALMLLGLLMPICAGVLISKLVDQEHKGNNWKLLLTNNSSFYQLWYSKFIIVYFLMELSTVLTFAVVIVGVKLKMGYPIPVNDLLKNFLAVSGANIISLTIAEGFSVYFKNQLIVLTVSLIGGFLGIISPLMPTEIVNFIPWGYYILSSLCRNELAGVNEAGRYIYSVVNIEPNYIQILSVTVLFIIINFFLAWYKSGREV